MGATVARAMTLQERIDAGRKSQVSPEEAFCEDYLARWKAICTAGDETAFRARLAHSGLSPADLGDWLGEPAPVMRRDWPSWAETLHAALECHLHAEGVWELGDREIVPFAPLLCGFEQIANDRLSSALHAIGRISGRDHKSVLQRALYRRLAETASQVFVGEFNGFRALQPQDQIGFSGGHGIFDAFLQSKSGAGLIETFARYPVLARFLAVQTDHWIAHIDEFATRLEADLPVLRSALDLTEPFTLRCDFSDPHRSGRSCLKLEPDAGAGVFYKPTALKADIAIDAFYAHLGHLTKTSPLRQPKTLNRGAYGWVKEACHEPCLSAQDVRAYYHSIGHLLFAQYLLGGADIHYENLIAVGDTPVVIDHECLMTNQPGPAFELATAEQNAVRALTFESVMRPTILPEWNAMVAGQPVDFSAIGKTSGQLSTWRELTLLYPGTDNMRLTRSLRTPSKTGANAVLLAGESVDPCDHAQDIIRGFEMAYDGFLAEPDLPADLSRDLSVLNARVVLRRTQAYKEKLLQLCAPSNLVSGPAAQLALESLFRPIVTDPAAGQGLIPAVQSEISQLLQLDIPVLYARADETALRFPDHAASPGVFPQSAVDALFDRISRMGAEDLGAHKAQIAASLACHRHPDLDRSAAALPSRTAVAAPSGQKVSVLSAVTGLADGLMRQAHRGAGGSYAWCGPVYKNHIGGWRVSPLRERVFDGSLGIALFLAASARVTGNTVYRDAAIGAVSNLSASALRGHATRTLMQAGLGCGTGVGSAIYGLCHLGTLTGQSDLLEDAYAVWRHAEDLGIGETADLGLLSGLAGYLNACLVLYSHRPCHELKNRCEALATGLAAMPLDALAPGFAHGRAGIACSLLRAARRLGGAGFSSRALELLEAAAAQPVEPAIQDRSWYRGNIGVCLAQIEAAELAAPVLPERGGALGRSLAQLESSACFALDDLSFGEAGFAYLLDRAAGLPDLQAHRLRSDRLFQRLLHRASTGELAFGWPSGCAMPGFFQGESGVGYGLIRHYLLPDLPDILTFS